MTEDLIEQVKAIEADADQIVSEAVQRAQQTCESVPDRIKALREEHRQKHGQELDAIRRKLAAQARQETQEVDAQAQAIAGRLDAVDPGAVSRAVDLILKHLSEG